MSAETVYVELRYRCLHPPSDWIYRRLAADEKVVRIPNLHPPENFIAEARSVAKSGAVSRWCAQTIVGPNSPHAGALRQWQSLLESDGDRSRQ